MRCSLRTPPNGKRAVIAGLPLATWVLFAVAVGAGLSLEIRFLRRHRGRR